MDVEPAFRGADQRSYDCDFPVEAVVPVEWYSWAQLERIAGRIRRSQSIVDLLLPIPKTTMKCQGELEVEIEPSDESKTKEKLPRGSSASSLNAFLNEDLSLPLQTVSPAKSLNRSPVEVNKEKDAVAFILEKIVDAITDIGYDQSRTGSPSADTAGERCEIVTPNECVQVTAEDAVSEHLSEDDLAGDSLRRTAKPVRFESKGQSENSYDRLQQRMDLSSHGMCAILRDINIPTEQTGSHIVYRKEILLAMPRRPESNGEAHSSEYDIEEEQTFLHQKFDRILRKLANVVMDASSSDILHRDLDSVSNFLDNVRLEKISARDQTLASKNDRDSADIGGTPTPISGLDEPANVKKLSDDERETRRELLELLFDPPYRKLPLMHILESAYHTLLIERCIERKLMRKKLSFCVRKKYLENQLEKRRLLAEAWEAKPSDSRPSSSSAKRRKFEKEQHSTIAAYCQSASIEPTSSEESTSESIATRQSAQEPALLASVASSKNTQAGVAMNIESVLHMPQSNPTLILSPAHSELSRSQVAAQLGSVSRFSAPKIAPLSTGPNHSLDLANHARLIKVELQSTSNYALSGNTATVQNSVTHLSSNSGDVGNNKNPTSSTSQANSRQFIQVPLVAYPVRRPRLISEALNSRLVMCTPAQLSALQSQVTLRGPLRIQHAKEHHPAAAVQMARAPDTLAAVPANAKSVIDPHAAVPLPLDGHPSSGFGSNKHAVILNADLKSHVEKPASTIAPRFFTVKQPYIAKPRGPTS